ncbi:Uncharacterised protein [uncultured archaeon]|nr:Uncharacterised protein [uncultured archaeon]
MDFIDFRFAIFGLHVLAALSFVLAVYFAFKLYQETDKGWYWLTLVLSALLFAVPQLLTFILPVLAPPRFAIPPPIIDEAISIAAGLLFALSCYGMYSAMVRIRKRVEPDGEEKKKSAKGARKR